MKRSELKSLIRECIQELKTESLTSFLSKNAPDAEKIAKKVFGSALSNVNLLNSADTHEDYEIELSGSGKGFYLRRLKNGKWFMFHPDEKQWVSLDPVVNEEDYPPYDPESDTFMDVPDSAEWEKPFKGGDEPESDVQEDFKESEMFVITAKSGPMTVYLVDSPTQGAKFVPNALSMARRFSSKSLAQKVAQKLGEKWLGLKDSIKVEKDPTYDPDAEAWALGQANDASMRRAGSRFVEEEEDDPLYVEYDKELQGEEPFMMHGQKFQYVLGKYPGGKKDICVYSFGQDMCIGYNAFRKMYNLPE